MIQNPLIEKVEMPLVLIEWVDSAAHPGHWQEVKDIDENYSKPAQAYTVGWLVRETDDALVIVPHLTKMNSEVDAYDGCGGMTIPKVAILKRHDLSDPTEEKDGPTIDTREAMDYMRGIRREDESERVIPPPKHFPAEPETMDEALNTSADDSARIKYD